MAQWIYIWGVISFGVKKPVRKIEQTGQILLPAENKAYISPTDRNVNLAGRYTKISNFVLILHITIAVTG